MPITKWEFENGKKFKCQGDGEEYNYQKESRAIFDWYRRMICKVDSVNEVSALCSRMIIGKQVTFTIAFDQLHLK